jgi:predicted LPLAT superfamily acyltransferase
MERENFFRKFWVANLTVGQSHPWKGKTGGGRLGQKSLFFLLRVINISFLYPFLFAIVPFYMLFERKGYKAIMQYFKQCHRMSAGKAFQKTYRNHLIFGQIVLDKFAVLVKNTSHFKIDITGKNYIDELMAKNTGFIVASSHIGNFEMGGFVFRQKTKRIYALVYGEEAKALQQNRIQALQNVNISAISVAEDLSHLFTIKKALEEGNILTVSCDRNYGSTKKVRCSFLGREAYFPLAPFRLAVQMNVPVVTLFMMKDNYKKYHAYIAPVQPASQEQNGKRQAELLTHCFVRNCEDIIRKYPEQWFNFYDFWENERNTDG